jgi:hypothetical protein
MIGYTSVVFYQRAPRLVQQAVEADAQIHVLPKDKALVRAA